MTTSDRISLGSGRAGSVRPPLLSPRLRYVCRKVGGAAVSLVVVLMIGFILFQLMPSDPVTTLTRGRPTSQAQLIALRHQLGLDQPLWMRFIQFMVDTLKGDLGTSWQFQEPVSTLIMQRIGPTLLLTGSAALVSALVGVWLGIHSGWRKGSTFDRANSAVALGFWSVPTFWLGMILLIVFSSGFGPIPSIFPADGMITPGVSGFLPSLFDILKHLVLPCLTLVLVQYAQYVTIARSSIIDEMGSPYLLTARAKGLADALVRDRHAVPNAMLPTITMIFMQIGGLIGGAITVETVFSWPGLGYLTYQALKVPDLPLLQGTFVIFSMSVIVMNLFADLLYSIFDPRVGDE
ncbi:MAG: ABC transporter permease [Bifidobacterium sp.]|jgi:peptide/nickel transport system permease protein|nr:ABC transporter permease [Bifidobacterium sp.]